MQTQIEQVYHDPDIYLIKVPLTGNALRNLNSYVIIDKGESLIIDTGFRNEECRQVLMDGLAVLGVSPEHTQLFLTHLHSDHIGLAQYFNYPGTKIYMGGEDFDYYKKIRDGVIRSYNTEIFLKAGFPLWELEEANTHNPVRVYLPSEDFPVVEVHDQDKIRVGGVELTALLMPGHTPGQMCLYIEKDQIMFTADHVLFDITPNITNWPGMENPLAQYMASLERILSYPVKTVFPAHRNLREKTMEQRITEIIAHHTRRLVEIIKVLKASPGSNAYDIASKLTWSFHGETWETVPKKQKWFAVGETLAHIDYLLDMEKIVRKDDRYYIK